jgi:hypothetical protein
VSLPPIEVQVAELKKLCPGLLLAPEGARTLYVLPQLHLLDGCKPAIVDALLCPFERDAYPFRLFFAELIVGPVTNLNWNKGGCIILDRRWFAFSWKVPRELRLIQMVTSLLEVMAE